jgi:hypothetical protein
MSSLCLFTLDIGYVEIHHETVKPSLNPENLSGTRNDGVTKWNCADFHFGF